MSDRANVPFTVALDAPLAALSSEVARACEVARRAIGPTARPTIIYQMERAGCLHITAVFVAGDDTPGPGEAERQMRDRIVLTPLAAPEPPALLSGPLALSSGGPGAATRGSWMQTATGRAFYPLAPEPHEIDLFEIASGLSRMCRYGGQIGRLEFYSVAEHCVLLSYAVPPELARWALLHDASEGLGLMDIPRPIKPALSGYAELEARLMRAVAARFGLEWPMPEALKQYDDRILQNERAALWAGPPPHPWASDAAGPPLEGITVTGWLPYQARARFLARADELGVRAVGV